MIEIFHISFLYLLFTFGGKGKQQGFDEIFINAILEKSHFLVIVYFAAVYGLQCNSFHFAA